MADIDDRIGQDDDLDPSEEQQEGERLIGEKTPAQELLDNVC